MGKQVRKGFDPGWLVFVFLLVPNLAWAGRMDPGAPASPREMCSEGSRDVDEDGLCDRLERATGTDPHDADTDGDSVPDGEEDANQDGRVDPGESDPRSPGLFPGSVPHIPEPLVFDLVRGLGASQGEIEANVLVLTEFDRRGSPRVEWAPEVEWAVLDGVAVELELPIEGHELAAVKSALQLTLPGGDSRFVHGVQVIGEHVLEDEATEGSLLYIVGARAARWSVLTMVGGRHVFGAVDDPPGEALLNPSAFYDVGEELTLGLETNLVGSMGSRSMRIVPQVHYQVGENFRVQIGGGLHLANDGASPLLTTRLVVE